MKIYKYFHSCVLLDDGKTRILFDPGDYCFLNGRAKAEEFTGIDAVVITHSHDDHADLNALRTIIAGNKPKIVSNSEVGESLSKNGVGTLEPGNQNWKIGDFTIKAFAAKHQELFKTVPENTAYTVNDIFLHPGDSLDPALYSLKVKVLALPIIAPWGKLTEFAEFAKNIKPEIVVPIHDGIAIDAFLENNYKRWEEYFSGLGIRFVPLRNKKEFLEMA